MTGLRHSSTPLRIVDLLELDPEMWWTVEAIMLELETRFGVTSSIASIRRSLARLSDDGYLETKLEEHANYETVPVLNRRYDLSLRTLYRFKEAPDT